MDEIKDLKKMDDEALDRLYMRLFSSDDGRLVLEDLRNRCFSYAPTVPEGGDINALRTHYNEGRRSILIMIETRLKPREEK